MGTLSEQLRRLAEQKQGQSPAPQPVQGVESSAEPVSASQKLKALAEARAREAELSDKRTIAGEAGAALKSVPRGLTGMVSGTLRGLGTLGNDAQHIQQSPLYRAGEALDEAMDYALPIPEEYQGRLPVDVGGGVGSMAGFMIGGAGGGMLARGASRMGGAGAKGQALATRAGQFGTAAGMAGPAGADEAYQRSLQAGLSPEEAKANAVKGIVPGVIQIANINFLLRALPPKVRGRLFEGAKGRLLSDGLSESAVEGAGAVGQNLIEMGYNPETGLFDGAGYQALIGGLSAAGVQGTRLALRGDGPTVPKADTETGGTETGEATEDEVLSSLAEQAAAMPEDQAVDFLQEQLLQMMQAPGATQGGDVTPPQEGMAPQMQGLQITPEQMQPEPAPQAAPQLSKITEQGTGVFRVPVDQIQVDPQQYQFRSRVNQDGVDQRLSGVERWDDKRAGNVLLHRRADGSLYVADGHHRVDLAKRLGQDSLNANIMDETDGTTVKDARIEAAMANVANEKAEALDIAKVFRDTEVPLDQVRSTYNLPATQIVRDGESLSRLNDNVFGMVAAGQLTDKDGAAIGRNFTDEAQQMAAADAFQKIQPGSEYQRELLVQEIRAADFMAAQGEQSGLFGDDEVQISLMQQRLAILDELRKVLNRDKKLYKSLNDNADRASEAGNLIAVEANDEISSRSARSLDLIGRVTTTPELNEMVNRATQRFAAGESKSAVAKALKQELMAYEQVQAGRTGNPDQRGQSAVRPGQDEGAGQRVPEPDTSRADGERESRLDREPAPEEVAPTLDLEAQTEEQLAEQARAQQEAADTEAKRKREEEQRAAADEQVDDFALAGSDRQVDQAEARGQNNLFDQPAEPEAVESKATETAQQTDAEKVEQAAAEVDQNPTESQIEAGNYKKGHVTVQGLNITLENPRGSTRSGTDPDGNEWSVTMAHHYGYLKRTEGADGEHVDVFVGNDLDSDAVFVVDQVNADGTFDEHKVLLGFKNQVQARKGYKDNYSAGWKVGPITRMTMDEFKAWLTEGDLTKPLKMEAATAKPEITWAKDGKNLWRSNDGQIIADLSFTSGGVRAKLFAVFADSSARDRGDNYTSGKTLTEAKRKAVAQPAAEPKTKEAESAAAPIEDFGEKIEGARKDYASKMKAAKEKDVAAVPLSESWPEPDYQKLLDSGADPEAVAFAHAARDEVPPKPRKGWKLSGWARQVEALRNFTESVIDGEFSVADVREHARKDQYKAIDRNVFSRADLYAAVGHSKSLKGLRFANVHYTMYEGKTGSFDKWQIESIAKTNDFGNMPRRLVSADTKEQAIEQFRKLHESLDAKGAEPKNTRFDIYTSRHDRKDVFIGKKIGKDVVRIKEGFTDVKEARQYLAEKQDVLERILAKIKTIPNHRKDNNSPRVGKDHRNGGDVTPEAFAETFGFRGVQFGNYVEQGRRQQDLNEAYDGLMDLAGILNIPAKAISLNGELGLAFGARGKGGKNAFSAHYEPSNIVINLTKKSGAGSLAHEWFHALDNYFARERGSKQHMGFATEGQTHMSARPEVAEAFRNIRQTVNRIRLRERSKKLDRVRTKAYWATDIEMTARSFESYVIEKLKDQGASNDYLANIVSENYWKASEALGMQDSDSYPYPEAAEIPEIRAAYDNLFEVIETRESDDGAVTMFSRKRGAEYLRAPSDPGETLTTEQARSIAAGLMKDWKGRPPVTVADSISEFPKPLREAIRRAGAESDMRAVFWNQHVYVLAPRIPSRQALEEVILHEVVGHYGLRKMLGRELTPLLNRVYMDLGDSARARIIKRTYFGNSFDPKNTEHRLTVAEELLAHLSESGAHRHRTLWERIVTAIRDGLRRLGFTVNLTETDLLKILAGAQRTVEEGGFSRPSDADMNFSRVILDLTDTQITKDGDGSRLKNPVTLKDGSRLSGFTDPQTQEVFFGYDQNGDQFTVRRDQVNPDDIVSSRDSDRTAGALREGLERVNFSRTDQAETESSESTNPDIRFSRTGNESAAHERQVKFMDGFATQPVDRLFRMVFDAAGMVDAHGRLKKGVQVTESAERIIKEWRPNPKGHFAWLDGPLETARHGLLDRHKLTTEYKKAWRQAEAYGRGLDMQALDILQKLEDRGIDGAEAQVLQKMLTGETVPNHELNAVAPEILRAIDDLGQAAVEYGIITREQFERNRGEYLHRSYLRHETQFTGLGKWVHNMQRSRNRKIKGDTAKGRGQVRKVPTAQLMQNIPVGWYGVKKEGDRPDMKLLHEQEFIILENPGEIADATDTLEGMEIPDVKTRNKGTTFWPASEPVPAKYEAWRNKGKWKVVAGNAGQVTLWRDWTKAERENMGEILDARYNIAMTFQKLSKDLAMGKFFQDVSLNPEWFSKTEPVDGTVLTAGEARSLSTLSKTDWVQVPDTVVSQSAGTKQWGALSGGYVRAEIWRDLNELDKMHNPGTWRSILTTWKLNKTARSPVVHMNNVMSNLMLMDLADVRMTDLFKGIQSYRARDEHWRAAQENGAFEGTFINEEIRQRVLQPVLDELMQQNLSADPSLDNTIGSLSKLGYTLVKHLKRADQKMTQFYQLEDELFRMATYMRRLDLGDSPAEAALIAREQFLDYDIRAPWINAARRTVLPFISYTYRAVPVVAQSIIHRPWKLAKYTTIAYLANALAYELAPGDEDEERRTMRHDQQGQTWLGTPRLVRMPWHDQHGNPVFVDVRRWVPAGDVYDMNQGQSALPIPAPIQWGGPIALAFEFVLNKQAFTGQEIVSRDTDTLGEATAKTASWLYKSWMPSAAYIPGSFYWDRVWTAAEGGRDMLGRPYSVPQALVSSIGIKAQPHDIKLGYEFRSRDLASQARIIQGDVRRAQSDLQRNIISTREYNKVTEGARRKLERLIEQQRELQGR